MRYVIMDAMLDWWSVFFLIFVAVWLLHSCYEAACSWWKEGKAEVIVEEMEHTDPIVIQASKVNPWRKL